MTATRRKLPAITVGRKVGAALAALWISMSLVSGTGWAATAFLVVLCVWGGVIGDMVGNAYQDAESA